MGSYPIQGFVGRAVSMASGPAFPPAPSAGDCFYRTDLNEFYIYDGAAWVRWEIETHAAEHQTGGTDDLESLLRLANFAERAHGSLTGVGASDHHIKTTSLADITDHDLAHHPLAIIPTMDDAHIPNLETLSYGGPFAVAQIPTLSIAKISDIPGTIATILTDHDLAHHALGTVVPHDALASLTERAHTSLTGVTPDQHHSENHHARHEAGGADALAAPVALAAIPEHGAAKHTDVIIVRKTSDEVVNNSTVLQDDDELYFAVGANEIWEFLLLLRVTTPTSGVDVDYSFTIPVAASLLRCEGYGVSNAEEDGTTEDTCDIIGASSEYCLMHYLYVGGANAGTVQLQWAQHTATVEDTKVRANSFIIARKLA